MKERKAPEKWGTELKEIALFYAQILLWVIALPFRAIWEILQFVGRNPRKTCQVVKGVTIAAIVVVAVTAAIRVVSFGTDLYAKLMPAPVETSARVETAPAETSNTVGVVGVAEALRNASDRLHQAVADASDSINSPAPAQTHAQLQTAHVTYQPDLIQKAGLVK